MTPGDKARLTQSLELPGAAAWCICTAAHAFEHHAYTDWFKPTQLEAMMLKLAGAMEGLRQRQIEPVQMCWVFEHARLFLVARADGDMLGLFVENRAGLNFSAHRAALADFAAGD